MSLWGEWLPQMDVNTQSYAFFLIGEKAKSNKRVGPHNIDVLSMIFGVMLGDAHAEFRAGSTRICFQQESDKAEYLYWLHDFFSKRGYCNPEKPKLQSRKGVNGKIRYTLRFKTWSFQSFNWIREAFYENKIKRIPNKTLLEMFFNESSLAVWIMDDGTRNNYGLTLSTHSFTMKDQ